MSASKEKAGDQGRFRCDPHPLLRSVVVEYWGMVRNLAAMGGFTITPDCFGELICCADDMFAIRDGAKEKLPTCMFIGLLDGPLQIEAPGIVRCMAARLQPWAVGQISAIKPDSPTRGWVDAGRIFGPRLKLASEMVQRCDWLALVKLFDEMLIEEIARWKPATAGIDMAEQFLGVGQRSTAIVARERDVTGRQVERWVRKLTRTSPKQLANLSRFQKVRDAIWADPTIDLASLAFDAGYSDQPHMTRQFRRYSGQTPAQFARSAMARKTWLAAHNVAFVQEGTLSDG